MIRDVLYSLKTETMVKKILFWLGMGILIAGGLFFNLERFPSIWWDEGWTLSVARNWVENGHFGHYLDGLPIPPRIPVRFPIVLPIALSFKIFGIGIWQGRLPGVLFTILALAAVFFLAQCLYGRRVGIATLVILVGLTPPGIHPFLIGRQVLAEMPMLFYLLGGYVLLWLTMTRSTWWSIPAGILWGIAIHAKLQVPPFWLFSITLALALTVRRGLRREAWILIGITIWSGIIAIGILGLQNIWMSTSFAEPGLQEILWNSIVLVLTWQVRITAIICGLIFGFSVIMGLWVTRRPILEIIGMKAFSNKAHPNGAMNGDLKNRREILEIALWGLTASWLGWYVFMGMFWLRYFFPAYFIGSIFAAEFLNKATQGFQLRASILDASSVILRAQFKKANISALVGIMAIGVSTGLAMTISYFLIQNPFGTIPFVVDEVVSILRQTQPGQRIETFESELYFLAPELRYHFPSDLISMQLVRKSIIDPRLQINYDFLQSDPDYLVVGPYAMTWKLYDPSLIQEAFELQTEIPGYLIYRRRSSFSVIIQGGAR